MACCAGWLGCWLSCWLGCWLLGWLGWLMLVLDLLRDGLVGALLQALQADLAALGLGDLLHEPSSARNRVRVALTRFAIAYDVIALRASLSGAVLCDVCLVDP